MQPASFQIDIAASPVRVHQLMLAADSYRQWTAVFNPDSHYVGDWQTGSLLHFVASENGRRCGMISKVIDNQPGRQVLLQHIGLLENDQ